MKWPWQKQERIDPLSFLLRAQAVQLRMEGVEERARRAAAEGNLEAVEAASREHELLLDNVREIRLEQLEAQANDYRRPGDAK